MHNRLDLKLSTLEYTGPECGSISLLTGEPVFCDIDCPVLMEQEPAPVISEIHKRMAGLPHDVEIAKKQAKGK